MPSWDIPIGEGREESCSVQNHYPQNGSVATARAAWVVRGPEAVHPGVHQT